MRRGGGEGGREGGREGERERKEEEGKEGKKEGKRKDQYYLTSKHLAAVHNFLQSVRLSLTLV